MSSVGTPSVIQITNSIPDSAASSIESLQMEQTKLMLHLDYFIIASL